MTTPLQSPSARTAELLRAGLSHADIDRHLAADRLRRVSWGVYARPSSGGGDSPAQRRHDHIALIHQLMPLFPGAHVVGLSACVMHDLPVFDLPEHLHIAREPRVRSRRDEVRTHRAWSYGVHLVDGIAVQDIGAALIHVAGSAGLRAGLVPADAALRRGMVTGPPHAALRAFGSRPGAGAARGCVELMDGRRESPLESWAALQAHVADIRLTPQPVIRDGHGEWVATADFVVEGRNVIVEVDGIGKYTRHSDFKNERVRHNQIEELGWIVVRITADDLRAGRFIPRLQAAIARSDSRARP